MGDSACLIHGFPYASAMPNESKQGNPMHVLGESISFGRFMTESLSWEKWSTFSHKKYVEEAERYARPGSVAQKKAFFEAHYKRIAAKKAAALLDQENAAKIEAQGVVADYDDDDDDDDDNNNNNNNADDEQRDFLNSQLNVDVRMEEIKIEDEKEEDVLNVNGHSSVDLVEIDKNEDINLITRNEASKESPVNRNAVNQLHNLENQAVVSASESSGSPKMERTLLKKNFVASEDVPSVTSKKRSGLSTLETSTVIENHVRKSSSDSVNRKRPSPKSLRALMNEFLPVESEKEQISATKKTENSGIALTTPQDSTTTLRTPVATSSKGVSTYPAATPQSENKRIKTPLDPSVPGSKTGPKWHILSAVCSKSLTACRSKLQSPSLSAPFIVRTEERAAKRKQKLEEKFNASEVQKMQQQKTLKEKAGNEFRKLGCSFCFKARPLPDFNMERETPKNHMKKTPASKAQTENKAQGTISMPPPPPIYSAKNSASKQLSKKDVLNKNKFLTNSLPERIAHENSSPNIQQ